MLEVEIGCLARVGISAIAQLLPLLDYVDMDGALFLGEDIATGVTIDRGRVIYPQENGCGVKIAPEKGRGTGSREFPGHSVAHPPHSG